MIQGAALAAGPRRKMWRIVAAVPHGTDPPNTQLLPGHFSVYFLLTQHQSPSRFSFQAVCQFLEVPATGQADSNVELEFHAAFSR